LVLIYIIKGLTNEEFLAANALADAQLQQRARLLLPERMEVIRGQAMSAPAPVAAMVQEDVVLGPNGRIIPIPDEVNRRRNTNPLTISKENFGKLRMGVMRSFAVIRRYSANFLAGQRAYHDIKESIEAFQAVFETYDQHLRVNRTVDSVRATNLAFRLLLNVREMVTLLGKRMEDIHDKAFFDFPDRDFIETNSGAL
jgi:DNA-binding helix-hairpin-helix protein with protein kinase domain